MIPKESEGAAAPEKPGPAQERVGSGRIVSLKRIEWIVAILLSAVVLFVLVARTMHAGPLWRDECDSLQLARMPRFVDFLGHLEFSSFPILFPAAVRSYTALFGTSDITVRLFGLAMGIFLLAVAWFQSWKVHREVPLLLPALIGLNANFLTAGLWLRGYGLGSVLIVLAFVLTVRFLDRPGWPGLAAVFIACLASMQSLFFNGALVPAIVLAAAMVLITRAERKWMWLLLGAAAVCGVSYLPYLWKIYFSTSEYAALLRVPVSPGFRGRQFLAACGGSIPAVRVAWLGLVLLIVTGGVWRLTKVWHAQDKRERDLLVFVLLTIPIGALAYYGFMRLLHNEPLQRYYLAIVCLIAAAAGSISATLSGYFWCRLARVIVATVALLIMPWVVWPEIRERQSNIDVIVQRVEQDARPADLIVVNPWTLGIAFNHYYKGANRWVTVPEMTDHRVHRYDLLKKKMTEFFPLDDVKREMTAALKAGNKVWIVGQVALVPEGRSPMILAPAPDPTYGWQGFIYGIAWSQELGTFMQRHAGRVDLVVRKDKSVSERENYWLLALEGWRY